MANHETEETKFSDDLVRVLGALHPKVELSERTAVATFHPQPEHRGNAGWLHGGLAATVLDHVCARAASAALGKRVVTGRLDLRYPKPVLLAEGPFRVEATAEDPRDSMGRLSSTVSSACGPPL